MLKRVDVAAYDTLKASMEGEFEAGINVLGIKEGGVDWAIDEHNKPLLTLAVYEAVEDVRKKILDGEIKVHNYEDGGDCPF